VVYMAAAQQRFRWHCHLQKFVALALEEVVVSVQRESFSERAQEEPVSKVFVDMAVLACSLKATSESVEVEAEIGYRLGEQRATGLQQVVT
jgi:hypothetical protein